MTAPALAGLLLVKPTLILAAAAAATACLRRSPAAARHAVWAGALLATLALPALSAVLPALRVPLLPAAVDARRPPASRALGAPPRARWETVPATPSDATPRSGASRRVSSSSVTRAVIVLWLAGALLLGVRRIVAVLRVRGLVARARRDLNPRRRRLLAGAVAARGARFPVELRISDEIGAPATAGMRRGVILLPAGAARWTDAELFAVFAHEVGHVARRDGLVHRVGDAAVCLYWFHPLVRMACRRLKSESERACDDGVLRSSVDPEEYARLLLRMASAGLGAADVPDPAIAMARRRELESRLRSLLDARASRRPLSRGQAAVLVTLLMMASLPAAALTLEASRTGRPAALPRQPSFSREIPRLLGPDLARARRAAARDFRSRAVPAPRTPEPDRLHDEWSEPASERLSAAPAPPTESDIRQTESGPDSALARDLAAALSHVPSHEGDLVRDRAAWALAQAREGRLVEPLLAALEDGDWRVRCYAAWALAAAHDPRAVPPLVAQLDHPVWRVRAMAAAALRASADPSAAAAMDRALRDPAWQVRVEAVEYFATLAGPAMAERLRPCLADRHVAVRVAAEHALLH